MYQFLLSWLLSVHWGLNNEDKHFYTNFFLLLQLFNTSWDKTQRDLPLIIIFQSRVLDYKSMVKNSSPGFQKFRALKRIYIRRNVIAPYFGGRLSIPGPSPDPPDRGLVPPNLKKINKNNNFFLENSHHRLMHLVIPKANISYTLGTMR